MTIEARHLRCFVAIATAGNITRAAAALHLSQPALSRALNQLEHELGVQLVSRSTHHLELTDAGVRFRRAAVDALDAFDNALAAVTADGAPLRVGHTWATGAHIAAIVRAWNAEHPGRALRLRRSEERSGGLDRGLVDIALTRGPLADPALRTAEIEREPRVAVLPADHPLAVRPSLTLADLGGEALIVHSTVGTTSLALWPEDHRPILGGTVTNTDDWLIAIASGTGIGVSVASTAAMVPHPDVRYVPLTDAPPVPLVLAWPSRDAHPQIREFVRVARRATKALRPAG